MPEYRFFDAPLSPHFSLLEQFKSFDASPAAILVDSLYPPGALSNFGAYTLLKNASMELAMVLRQGDARLIVARGQGPNELRFNAWRRTEITRLRREVESYLSSLGPLERAVYELDDIISPWMGYVTDDNLSPLLGYLARRVELQDALESVETLLDRLDSEHYSHVKASRLLLELQVELMVKQAAE